MAKDLIGLVEDLKGEGVLKTPRIIGAFENIDRKDFVLPEYEHEAYGDYPLPIGHGQTISQPYTVALMLELLEPKERERILDVGSGSGWTTALLGYIVGENGFVCGTEIVPELVALGKEHIARYALPQAEIHEATEKLGLPEEGPFDKILVSAGGATLPKELVEQLTVGGIMVIPVAGGVWKVTRKKEGEPDIEKCEGFAFVPLLHSVD